MRIPNEPRPHFSFSQMDQYLSCPHKYYLGYVKGIQWCYVPSAVAFGSVTHTVLEGFHRSLIAGSPQSSTHLQQSFAEQWQTLVEQNHLRFNKDTEPDELKDRGIELVGQYHAKFHTLRPKAVELDFRLPMVRSDTGQLSDRDLVGKIDVVEEDNTPWELKTSGKSLSQAQVDKNLQLTLYSWALSMLYGEHVGTVKVVNLVRTKQPKIQVIETHRTPQDHQKLMKILFGVGAAISQNVFYPNPNNSYGCGNCTFSPICEFAMV